MNRRKGLGALLAASVVSAVALMASGASAATDLGQPATIEPLAAGAHGCRVLGNDGTTQGVICADLVETTVNGITVIYPQAEGMCQTMSTGDFVQCANITLDYDLWDTFHGHVSGPLPGGCGHSAGPCATPRAIFSGYQTGRLWVNGGPCVEAWTVVDAGAEIELPGSRVPVFSTTNLGSGHVKACPQ